MARAAAANAAEAAYEATREKTSNKRERSPPPDAMDDIKGTGDITPVATSEPDAEIPDAVQAAQECESAQTAASSQQPAPPIATLVGDSQGSTPAAAAAATGHVLGPLGTAPYGAQAPTAAPAPAARPRTERERSPRREAEALPAAPDSEDETPQLTSAQAAALRGDSIGGSLDSLPAVEEEPTPLTTASNARGGASLT